VFWYIWPMTDPNEISALKASYRGAVQMAQALADMGTQIEGLDPAADPSPALLDDLARVTAAHAVASAALRGLVNTMLARRGKDDSLVSGRPDPT
jgi:hypothetical protein